MERAYKSCFMLMTAPEICAVYANITTKYLLWRSATEKGQGDKEDYKHIRVIEAIRRQREIETEPWKYKEYCESVAKQAKMMGGIY